MQVRNIHERELAVDATRIGRLIDTLASPRDELWPSECWPRMKFDRPLMVGAAGGHGPVRYVVDRYQPGRSIRFRFQQPAGFNGFHGFEAIERSSGLSLLRHTLEIKPTGPARLSWPLVFRPLHNALIEDSLSRAEAAVGLAPRRIPWSLWVRFLRRVLSTGRAKRPAASAGEAGDVSSKPAAGAKSAASEES